MDAGADGGSRSDAGGVASDGGVIVDAGDGGAPGDSGPTDLDGGGGDGGLEDAGPVGSCDAGDPCPPLCAPGGSEPDALEPNNTALTANPIEAPALGTRHFTYDITLLAGDEDWFQFGFPPPGAATTATLSAEVTCASWATQGGCGVDPAVGLAAWYFDDVCTPGGQQQSFHPGTNGLASVSMSGEVSPFGICVPQKFRLRAFPSATVCTGEAISARVEVTVTFQ